MPYSRLSELPKAVRDNLPVQAQHIWWRAHDNALKEYDGDEAKASATAWAAVKDKYKKNAKGEWVAKADLDASSVLDWLAKALGIAKAAQTKTIDGKAHPASCFLVVPDPEKPSTWALPVKDPDGTPNHTRMGAAYAALTSGYRGQTYDGPDKGAALAKLRNLYRSEKMPWPGDTTKADVGRVEIQAEVRKVDAATRKVWGWASVIKVDGQVVVDKQGDVIEEAELQAAVHDFVKALRHTKVMHSGEVVGEVVDSFVFTEDVQKAFGIDLGRVGWAMGMEMPADVVARVEAGELPMLSISGTALREVIADAD